MQRSICDWLPEFAAVFTESQYLGEICTYITAQRGTSVVKNSDRQNEETGTERRMMCDADTKVSLHSNSGVSLAEYPTPQSCTQMTSDSHLPAADVLVQDTATTNSNVTTAETDGPEVKKCANGTRTDLRKQQLKSAAPQKKTCLRSASAAKQFHTNKELQRTSSVLPDVKVDGSLTTGSSSSADADCSTSLQTDTAAEPFVSASDTSLSVRSSPRKRSSKTSVSKQSTVSETQPSSISVGDASLMNGLTVCEICGAVVKCLKSHLLKHGEAKHKCRHCPFATRQLQSLRIHEHRIHTNYRPHLCEACGKSFVKSTLLKEHINEKHGSLKRERRYNCSSCNYSAYTRSILQRHELKHAPCRRPQHRCDVCGARLMTVYSLNEHKRLSHVDERPFPCAICGFSAKSVKRLRSHMRCHGEKSFACDQCVKRFTARAQLVRHQLVHSGVKAFVCPYCAYRSAIVENLRKHCHAVHKVLYPPKKRDVARADDSSAAVDDGVSTPGRTSVQACTTLADCTTSAALERCTTVTLALLPVSAVLNSSVTDAEHS